MKTIITFGEIMGRLAPPGHKRFRQSMPGPLEMTFAGAEANVAASVAYLGGEARFVTALPENPIAEACLANLRSFGVDVASVIRHPGRLGLYFVETGANQRPGRVVYDRDHSSVSRAGATHYDWEACFRDGDWLHLSGITPALSQPAAEACLEAARQAHQRGLKVSCDLNFRNKLWQWREGTAPADLAGEIMRDILPYVQVVIANEEDAEKVLGIRAEGSDVEAGQLDADRYPEVARRIAAEFDRVETVAITLRESVSASHNNWGAMLYDAAQERAVFAPLDDRGGYAPYPITDIVDRVGGGDSFAAGLIFALNTPELAAPERALPFAVAASCLAHSISGDFNLNTREEVESLMAGSGSGRVVR